MVWYNFWKSNTETKSEAQSSLFEVSNGRQSKGTEFFKAYIPNFLYKPPYGMPRRVNLPLLKQLSKNPYVFSVIKTLCDEASSMKWEIKIKDEYNDKTQNYKDKIKEVTKFFKNPNGNEESFEHILRQLITDICEIDSGVLVKVYDSNGDFKHLFSRDGSTFLKNPNIYGYIGDRADFVPPIPIELTNLNINLSGTPTKSQQELIKQYEAVYIEQAAYFQYGWTAGSMPVPFGKREIVFMMQNPRSDSIYGRSPIEVLTEVILSLVYGSEYNLDYYINNNMPDGVAELLGASRDQIKQFRENFENQFREKDSFGKKRKINFKVPVTNVPFTYKPFTLNPRDMEIIAQQEWFTKVLWMCFGVTADEMGFTEKSNKAVSEEQSKLVKRKALKPILNVIEYHLNTQLIPEFFSELGEDIDFSLIPIEFKFIDYDFEEDQQRHNILEQELRMGVKTPEMAAVELDIDVLELKKYKDEEFERQKELITTKQPNDDSTSDFKKKDDKGTEQKSSTKDINNDIKKTSSTLIKEIDNYISFVKKQVMNSIDLMPNNQFFPLKNNSNNKVEEKSLLSWIMDKFTTLMTFPEFDDDVKQYVEKKYLKGLEDTEIKFNMNFIPQDEDISFLKKYVQDNVKQHTDSIGNNLRQEISRGMLNKESVDQLKKRIKDVFNDDRFSNRLKTVLRTEGLRANNMGQLEGAKQSKLSLKKYVSIVRDNNTSAICLKEYKKYGKPSDAINLDEEFVINVDNKTMRSQAPPFHPNCRTVLRFVRQ